MARTTLDLDPAVLAELRRRAARDGKSIGAVASELVARATADDVDVPSPEFVWSSARLGRLAVDLEDKAAVRRIVDSDP